MPRAGYGELTAGAETSAAQALHPPGSEAAPGSSFTTDPNTGMYLNADDTIGLTVNATDQVLVTDGGFEFQKSTEVSTSSGTLTITSPTITAPTIGATAWANATHTHAGSSTGGTVDATTATTATNITASANNSTDETVYPAFVDGATGSQGIETDTGLTYNPSSGILTATQFTGAVSGNATTATTATTATNVTASANNSTDETVYPTFVDGATGGQGIETDTGLTYNPSTGAMTSTTFVGAVTGNVTGNVSGSAGSATGNAATATALATARNIGGTSFDGTGNIAVALATEATNVTASANNSTDETVYPVFVDGATGTQGIETDTGFSYNPSTGALTATSFTGAVTGTVTGAASEVTVSANNSTDETVYPVFVDGATGSQGIETDTGLTYNPSTGVLTGTQFTGNVTGNVTGNASGSSGSTTGNAATATALASARTIGGTSFDGTANIAVALSATTTALASARTIGGTSFDGTANIAVALSAVATEATNITTTANNSTDETVYPTFVDGATGTQGVETDSGFTYNPSSGLLTITGELDAGSLDISGNADIDGTLEADAITVDGTTLDTYIASITVTNATTAATGTEVTTSANNSTNETVYPTFVDGATGSQGIETDTGLTYNPSTGLLTAAGFSGPLTGNVTGNASGTSGSTTGNAATATALASARTIGGTSFDGTANIAVGLAATATALASARTIGGVSFDGTGNIDLPGVNAAGNQATSGLAATATLAATTTALATARDIGGVSFDGTGNITLPGVNSSGNQNTSGTAAGLSATLVVANGGTGATSLTDKAVLISQDSGTDTVGSVALTTSGQLIIGGSSGPAAATLTAGSNITIAVGDGSITITASGGGVPNPFFFA